MMIGGCDSTGVTSLRYRFVTFTQIVRMRYPGKLIEWNDGKGFRFVLPNAAGRKIFVHFNAFASRERLPVVGDLLSFEVGLDANKRSCAAKVAPVVVLSAAVGHEEPPTRLADNRRYENLSSRWQCS